MTGTAVDEVRVVVGHEAEQVIDVGGLVRHVIVHNREFERGMLSSVQAGIKALPHGTTAFLLWPVDQPLVRGHGGPASSRAWKLRRAGRGARPPREARAPDAVLDQAARSSWVPPKARERGPSCTRTKALVEVEVDDAGILTDIDTPQAYLEGLRPGPGAGEAAPVEPAWVGIWP